MTDPVYIASLERLIGAPAGDSSATIGSGNRQHVRAWLVAHGIDATRVDSMRDGTLWKAYTKPQYLRAMLTRGDYNPAVRKAEDEFQPVEPEGDDDDYSGDDEAPEAPKPAPVPRPTPAPAATGQAAQLAAMIQSIAAGAMDEGKVIELIQRHAPKPDAKIVERLVIVPGELERRELPDAPRHVAFPDVLTMVACRIPVMLVGPAGSGKTTAAHGVADALALRFLHCGAIGSRYELSGFTDAQGRYQRTVFRDAYEHGGLMLWDEVDASDPNALTWANTAIANGECSFPDGIVKAHEDFRLIAAANTFGRGADRLYVGRNQLDAASLDRFAVLDFDYDEALERTLFGDNDWTARVQAVRAAVMRLKLRHVVSPRATDHGARLIKAGMARPMVEAVTLWKGLSAADIAKVNAEARA